MASLAGSALTALFAENRYTSLDGYSVASGWPDHSYITLGYNLAGSVSIFAWSATISYILLFVIDKIPFFHFRANEEEQILGSDLAFLGESLYDYHPLPKHEHSAPGSVGSIEKLGAHEVTNV
jgi:Amt family ammonium transporter